MSDTFQIKLTAAAEKIVASYQTLPVRVINYIAAAMDRENLQTVSHIQREHLTGKGPFPPEEHKLGVVTNRLRQSLWASGAQETSPGRLESAIGTNVKYAAIHEFGGRIQIPARQGKVRHRTDARGNLVKQLGNSNLLMFAKAGTKRARETTVQIPAHDIEMPERAPIHTGITECQPNYRRSISAAIVAAMQGGSVALFLLSAFSISNFACE